ncbi:ERCC4 domain-containing protein [Lapillicoccus sp.]|uniref:ERCC4 domain-containing protein n=1 Tax=Lapillicoccus sp. TaxID=1909287 RepID=UPI0025F8429C|nr:ERCC4 domain-containing protein [Lapillicoccus sp.]
MTELLIARNPDPDSSLSHLLLVPLGAGLLFRTSGTWPRTRALFCYPVHLREWPAEPDIIERVAVRSCERRGAAIDLVLDRAREHRSQIVFTKGRGRDMVFWQSSRTRKQARPDVTLPTARAAGLVDLEILVDSRERYAYRFTRQQVTTVKESLPCGDYAVRVDGRLVASVERKSLSDLVSSVSNGRLRFAMTELAALPRAAVVVEDRYSALFKQSFARPAMVADGLAELQVRYPNVPIVFCENRALAEEWTYRLLAAAYAWAQVEQAAVTRIGVEADGGSALETRIAADLELADATGTTDPAPPPTAQVRAWARAAGIPVPDRGRLRPEVWGAWQDAHA